MPIRLLAWSVIGMFALQAFEVELKHTKWSCTRMAYTNVRRLMLPDRISQELLNFSRSVASRFNSIIS